MLPPQHTGPSSLLNPPVVPLPKCLCQRRGGAALPALWGFRAPGLSVGAHRALVGGVGINQVPLLDTIPFLPWGRGAVWI